MEATLCPSILQLQGQIYNSWRPLIDESLIKELQKYRQYNFNSILDLFRMVRNVSQHYKSRSDQFILYFYNQDMDCPSFEEWKEVFFNDPEKRSTCIIRYFCQKTPRVIVDLYTFQNSMSTFG